MEKENPIPQKVRLDKYLWAIRIFKTRSIAAASCDKGRVTREKIKLKAAYSVKPGDIFHIKMSGNDPKIIEVVGLIDKRLSSENVKPFFIDRSPEPPKVNELPSAFYESSAKRKRGTGRPSKKEGREIRKFQTP
jgi:ribosome-associated heat shock protein Hsp15